MDVLRSQLPGRFPPWVRRVGLRCPGREETTGGEAQEGARASDRTSRAAVEAADVAKLAATGVAVGAVALASSVARGRRPRQRPKHTSPLRVRPRVHATPATQSVWPPTGSPRSSRTGRPSRLRVPTDESRIT